MAALRLVAEVLCPKTIFVNAAGCFTLLAVFPYTPFIRQPHLLYTQPEQKRMRTLLHIAGKAVGGTPCRRA